MKDIRMHTGDRFQIAKHDALFDKVGCKATGIKPRGQVPWLSYVLQFGTCPQCALNGTYTNCHK